ncbi:unnamed protein product [Adineta steineri]|uniref:EGF-like domain-containing protein n=1 Tax=Adineta steineri TaxID=433720 RepID=A0A815D3F5_9BILA|nr:unnamed protein product [Adineta steineri]CAF1349991.1 unnamed protein product [Adineta steineri]
MNTWFIFTFIELSIKALVTIHGIELIHDTDILPNAQYFDCLDYTNEFTNTRAIKYCIQPKNITNYTKQINADDQIQCENGGVAYSFSSLFKDHIDPSTVLSTFHSGIEQADRYGTYYFRRKENDSSALIGDDDYVCNCSSSKGVFGRHCEYKLYVGHTLAETARLIKTQNNSHALAGQLQRRRMCYTSIDCEYGLLCLDWRDICDGAQNCMNGVDEENCGKVEMNECLENEFRCQNGLCIPEEYWLDGEFDCQDTSDELTRSDFEESCPREKGMECDEHICQEATSFSCGDGQCTLPYTFTKSLSNLINGDDQTFICSTLRDLAFFCEIHQPMRLWTLKDGFCVWFSASWSNQVSGTLDNLCEFLLKCRLSRSLSTICPTDDIISLLLKGDCRSKLGLIKYPPGPLLGPLMNTYYDSDYQLTPTLLPNYAITRGQMRCAGFQLTITGNGFLIPEPKIFLLSLNTKVDRRICRYAASPNSESSFIRNYSILAPHFDTVCWHKWLPYFNLSTVEEVVASCSEMCLSPHRIHDGIGNCRDDNFFDETTIISPIQHYNNHCLNCLTHKQEAICLPVFYIGTKSSICADGEDIYLGETNIALQTLKCNSKDATECHIIRSHIIQPSINKNNMTIITSVSSSKVLPFAQYCDTFSDTAISIDENVEHCLYKWICADNEYRCLTGQCIPFIWLCDGEWDCSDASDEQGLLLQVGNFTDKHNQLVLNFTKIWTSCFERYKEQPFANLCNITIEYPCLLANVDNPLNFTLNPPCIGLERIGDGRIDCLGKIDERNLFKCDSDVLGWGYGCTDPKNACIPSAMLCSVYFICSDYDKRMACFYKDELSCNGLNDAMCLNGTCQRNARCNKQWDCLNGEDEYWCHFGVDSITMAVKTYRSNRRIELQSKVTLIRYTSSSITNTYKQLPQQSSIDNIQQIFMRLHFQKQMQTNDTDMTDNMMIDEALKSIRENPELMLSVELPFICNRGIPIKDNHGQTRCLCSPSYYGDYCEFHADRISVVTHLNLTTYNGNHTTVNTENSTGLVSCTFRYAERIVDRHEFYVHSIAKTTKQKFYFSYSRTAEFKEQKRLQRHGTQLYSIRFEAFYLQSVHHPVLLAMWQFRIDFDFLPAFRFAKVLHFNMKNQNYSCDLICGPHGKCIRLENEIKNMICTCESGWYGDRCELYDEQCENFCHPQALCRPQERGFINGDRRPACLCPHRWLGATCHLTYPECKQCQNGGTCYLTYDRSHTQPFECICTNDFYGEYCQFPKRAVLLRIDKSSSSSYSINILATSIQYYDVTSDLADLYLRKQQIFPDQPSETQMGYEQDNAPSVILIKSYNKHYQLQGPLFHLVYSQHDVNASINMTVHLTNENECVHTHTLFDPKIIQNTDANILVFKYHEPCQRHSQNRSSKVCFRDENYFCLCNTTIHHSQCLRFDPYSDKCQHCLSGAPFAIQVTAITLLIISAAKSRARTGNNHATTFTQILRKQFKTQKELYVTPTIIILAALPQIIITSSFACTELSNAWQRYALLVSYLFSFTPQIFGFMIYVLPSSSYKTEFINTEIGRKLFRIKINNQNNNRTNVLLATKQHKTRL